MSWAGGIALGALTGLLSSEKGLEAQLAAVAEEAGVAATEIPEYSFLVRNAAAELEDRAAASSYPQVLTYCSGVENSLVEKFRQFSGRAELVIEIRVSGDRIAGLENETHMMCAGVTKLLQDCRGQWQQCVYYAGKYEVEIGPVKRGGLALMQITKIKLPVDVAV